MQGADKDEALLKSPVTWSMGFRPFFLGSAAFAIVATALWLHALTSGQNPSGGYLSLNLWHAHEMVFGFTYAVVAGFVLTAARNWTGRNTLHGLPLMALTALWLLGRLGMSDLLPGPDWLLAAILVAFPLVVAVVAGRVIFASRSKRNYGVVGVLAALTAAEALVQLEALGLTFGVATPTIHAAVHLMVLLIVVVGGRIIPMFTRNRTKAEGIHNVLWIDRLAIGAAALVALLAIPSMTAGGTWTLLFAGVAALSGVLQLFRLRTWGFGASLRIPMLLVLHLGYAWIGLGQLLLAASVFVPALPLNLALHALTIGTIGVVTLGMMARVTLGHTGRIIESTPPVAVAFLLMNLAALARLAGAVAPGLLVTTWIVSGALFAAAWAIYLVFAFQPLTTPRPDGRPG